MLINKYLKDVKGSKKHSEQYTQIKNYWQEACDLLSRIL
jgi:hypothetical protein